jgi:DNA replication licensing factor MCM2
MELADQGIEYDENEADDKFLDIEDVKGKVSTWIKQPRTIRWIRRVFAGFIRTFKDEETGEEVYEGRINDMCINNKQSLEITYSHLSQKNPTIAIWLAEEPALILPLLNDVAFEIVSEAYPNYDRIFKEIFVRIKDLPIEDSLRELRQVHLNALIKIRGVVTKRTGVFPQLKKIFYNCQRCGDRKGPIYANNMNEDIKLGSCIVCQSNGPFTVDTDETIYRNYQKITVQESPGSVPPGRVPR